MSEWEVSHGHVIVYLAAIVCLIPVIIAFLIAPGGIPIRIVAALATLVSFVLGSCLAWYLDLVPTEPLAAFLAIASLAAGWLLAKFLDRRLNEKPASGGITSPKTGLR